MITPKAQLTCSAPVKVAEAIEKMAQRLGKTRAATMRHLLIIGYNEVRAQEKAAALLEPGVDTIDDDLAADPNFS